MWATAGSSDRVNRCAGLGAQAINYRTHDFVERVTQVGGADVILDVMGAAYLERNLAALAVGGRLVVIGMQGGVRTDINLGSLLAKRARIIGTTLRSRPLEERRAIVAGVRQHVWPLVPEQVRPIVHTTYPLDQAANAHIALDSGEVFGKVVLTVDH